MMAQFVPQPPCPDGAILNLAVMFVLATVVLVAVLVWMLPEIADAAAKRLSLRAMERREILDLLKQQKERRHAEQNQ